MMTEEQKQALILEMQSEKLVLEKWRDDWNARDKVNYQAINIALAALTQPASHDVSEFAELIEGMDISVDVSTGDHDAGNRYFGTVTEVVEHETGKNGFILLVQDAEPNFTQPASPALKLPETISVRTAIAALDNASAVTTIAQSYKMAWNSCIAETKRLNAPQTAPIESTGCVKVPEGWSLVPNEATGEMIEEGDQWELSENIWNAMRGVAPKP